MSQYMIVLEGEEGMYIPVHDSAGGEERMYAFAQPNLLPSNGQLWKGTAINKMVTNSDSLLIMLP